MGSRTGLRAHHLWPFLVDYFLSAEALPHDLVVRLAHNLRKDQTTEHNHKQVIYVSNSDFIKRQLQVESSTPQ